MYNDYQKSIEDSNYLYLIRVTVGTSKYYYTTGEQDMTVAGNSYKSYPGLKTTDLGNSSESQKNEVEISLDTEDPLAAYLLNYVPSVEITVLIESLERDDLDQEIKHEWTGAYLRYDADYPDFRIICVPVDRELERDALSTSFGVGCQWTQYDANTCGLNTADFDINATITAVDGLDVTVAVILDSVSADHYVGGQMSLPGPHGTEYAWVTAQAGSYEFTIDRNSPNLAIGADIVLVASCRGDFNRCKDPLLFNNKIKYMGAPHANKLNPFSSDVRGEF